MKLKEFFIPTLGKLLLLIAIVICLYILTIFLFPRQVVQPMTVMPTPWYSMIIRIALAPMIILISSTYGERMYQSIPWVLISLIVLIGYYLLSCLIIWMYKKAKKK